jgi:hypothetical protein
MVRLMYKGGTNFIPQSKFQVLFLPKKDFGERITCRERVPFSKNTLDYRIHQNERVGHGILQRASWGDFRENTGPGNFSEVGHSV